MATEGQAISSVTERGQFLQFLFIYLFLAIMKNEAWDICVQIFV